MKTFSKVIAFIGMIAMLFSLVGCGKKGGDDTPKVPTKLIAKYSDGTEVTSLNLEVGESKTIEFSTDLKDKLTISKLKNAGEPIHVSCDKNNLSFTITGLTATGEQPENLVFTYKVDANKTLTLTIPVTVYEYEPTELMASSTEETLRIGEVKVIALTTNPENRPLPEGAVVGWTSSNLEIASVADDGTVTGVAAGEATITATYKDLTATVNVTVKDSVAESLEAVIDPTSVKEGETANITLKVKYDDADSPEELKPDARVSFEADKDVVSIDKNGVVTAKEVAAKTTVNITVTYIYKEGATPVSDDVELEIVPIVVDSLIAAIDQESLKEGETANISLKVKYADGTESVITSDKVEIVADNDDAVTIENGVITAKEVDVETTVNITVTYKYKEKDYTAEVSVKVLPYVAKELVAKAGQTELTLEDGKDVTTTITLTTEPDSKPLAASEAEFSVEENAAVTVSLDGVVTAVKPGTATVTVTYGDFTSEIVFTVNADPNVAIEWPITDVDPDGAGVFIYLDNTNLGLVPSFEDENEATSAVAVDANGNDITITQCFYQNVTTLYVTTEGAHPNMTLTITGTIAGQKYESVIKIVEGQWDDPSYEPTKLVIKEQNIVMYTNDAPKSLTVTKDKGEEVTETISWTSSNNDILSVENGTLSIVEGAEDIITESGEVEVTITASTEGLESATTTVLVKLPLEEGAIDWDIISWVVGSGDKYKVHVTPEGPTVVNVQHPGFAKASGIYITFPVGVSSCSLGTDGNELEIEGAAILVYLDSLAAKETTFTVNAGNEYTFTILNVDGGSAIKLLDQTYFVGDELKLPLKVSSIENFDYEKLEVTSDNELVASVAIVGEEILLTAKAVGEANITATYTDEAVEGSPLTTTAKVTVNAPIEYKNHIIYSADGSETSTAPFTTVQEWWNADGRFSITEDSETFGGKTVWKVDIEKTGGCGSLNFYVEKKGIDYKDGAKLQLDIYTELSSVCIKPVQPDVEITKEVTPNEWQTITVDLTKAPNVLSQIGFIAKEDNTVIYVGDIKLISNE